jgi:hypothetical protein
MGESRVSSSSSDQVLQRIAGEYREMPGLRLTTAQAQRLFHLDAQSCTELLRELVHLEFLTCAADGRYARASTSATVFPIRRMAKAQLDTLPRTRVAKRER